MKLGDELERDRAVARRNTAVGFVVGMMFGGLVDAFTGDLGIGTLAGMVLGSLLGYYGLPRIHSMEYESGALLRVLLAGLLFVAVLCGVYLALDKGASQSLETLLPFAPALPGLLLLAAMGQALASLDELQRRIQIEAIAIGFGITAIAALTVGLLGMTGTSQPNWTYVPVLMVFAWLLGKIWTRWQYR